MSVTHSIDEAAPELDFEQIEELAGRTSEPDRLRIADILQKAKTRVGLDLDETADLLRLRDPELRRQVLGSAREVKEAIYGRRMVLFAPLYASNECSNNCLYCAFRRDNTDLVRRTLTMEEIAQEIRVIEDMGHKRVLLVLGEADRSGVEYAENAVRTTYETTSGRGEIRRVNVNMAPLSVEGF